MSEQIKKQLVEIARLAYQKDMVNTYEGNISVLDNNRVYITPSGMCKGFLTEDMIPVTDLEGNVLEGSYKPSSEIRLHLGAYKSRPDIKAVVHSHCPYATAYAIANKPIETKAYPEMIVFFDKIPLAAYGTQGTDEIFQGVKEYIQEYDVILLANHGVIAVGGDVCDAFFKLEAAEAVAKTLTLARMVGGEKELPPDKLEELYEIRRRKQQKR